MIPLKSTSFDGKNRTLYPIQCLECPNIFYRPKHRIDGAKHCSKACTDRSKQTPKVSVTCGACSKPFVVTVARHGASKSGVFFCTRKCKDVGQSADGILKPSHFVSGVCHYRKKALKYCGAKCSICQYDEDERMLDADHINGDRSNNLLENLQILCVWCHALKTRGVTSHTRPMGV